MFPPASASGIPIYISEDDISRPLDTIIMRGGAHDQDQAHPALAPLAGQDLGQAVADFALFVDEGVTDPVFCIYTLTGV